MKQRRHRLVVQRPRAVFMPRLAAALALGLLGAATTGLAQITGDPAAAGKLRPTVLAAPNGVPLVNIQTPSAAGVSRNVYSRFDVDARGAILNNSRTETPTQLGGWVMGNPWLARGPARVILNEVNASDPSRLRGYLEVAGQRAQVVVANPSGISCDGCGFINASRALLTTGTPRLQDDALAGLRVERGVVDISGAGLDGRALDFTEIIARAVRVDADLVTTSLSVVAGAHEVDLDAAGASTRITPVPSDTPRPAVAIDVSALGGMYAGQITLVGHGAGVGVRNAGVIGATAGDVRVTAQGRLENAGIVGAAGSVHAQADEGLVNTGAMTARANLRLSTHGDLEHHGVLTAGGDLALAATGSASQMRLSQGSITAAGVQDDGSVGATGLLTVAATEAVQAAGRLLAGEGVAVQSTRIDLSASRSLAPVVSLRADAGDVVLTDAVVRATRLIDVHAAQALRTDGAAVVAPRLQLSAASLSNRGGEIVQTGPGELALRLPGDLDNQGGLIAAHGSGLALGAAVLSNAQGRIASAGDLSLIAERLANDHGLVTAQGALQAEVAGRLDNPDGLLAAAGPVRVSAGSIANRAGTIASVQGSLAITSAGLVDNTQGQLQAASRVDLQSNGLDNRQGLIAADQVAIDAGAGAVSNAGGRILATGAQASGALTLRGQGLANDEGLIHASGDLVIDTQGQALTNTRTQTAIGEGEGEDRGLLAGGAMAVRAGRLDNRGGRIESQGDARFTIDAVADNRGGLMRSGGRLAVAASAIGNEDTQAVHLGLQGSVVDLRVNDLSNAKGAVRASERLAIAASDRIANTEGVLASAGALEIGSADASQSPNPNPTATIDNRAGLIAAGTTLRIEAAGLSGDGALLSQGDLQVKLLHDYLHTADLIAGGSARLETAGTLVNEGRMAAGETLSLLAAGIDNRAGASLQASHLQLETDPGGVFTNRGLIAADSVDIDAGGFEQRGTGRVFGDRIGIRAQRLINEAEAGIAPVIAARQQLDLGVGSLHNAEHALIFSAGNLAIGGTLDAERRATGAADTVTNTSATLEALGQLRLASAHLLNADAHFSAGPVPLPDQAVTQLAGEGSLYRYLPDAPGVYIRNEESDHLYTPEGRFEKWTRYDVIRSAHETRVITADPARIVSGDSMRLDLGRLSNDKSHILAGGALDGQIGAIDNLVMRGERVSTDVGTATSFWRVKQKGHDRTGSAVAPYTPPDKIESIDIDPSLFKPFTQQTTGGTPIAAPVIAAPGAPVSGAAPAGVPSVNAPAPTAAGAAPPVRVGSVDTRLPANSLWRVAQDPARPYLVETDTRFTDHRQWLGSDYLLSALTTDPATTHKRLGDGFYEQRLVREQVAALTGRRFLEGYASDEAQFQALMDHGATFARAHAMQPGLALSAEQIAQLTSDIVWLVAQTVTLADGSTVQALVPQLYVRVAPGDLQPSGALIAARELRLNVAGEVRNAGTIVGHHSAAITADHLRNAAGLIAGDEVRVHARTDLDNIGGIIRAQSHLSVTADRDIRLETTTVHTANDTGQRVAIDRVAGLQVTGADGHLQVEAGRDLHLTAASIDSRGTGSVVARRDLHQNTVTELGQGHVTWDSANHRSESVQQEVGTQIRARGDLQMWAGNDLRARAATATSEEGAVTGYAQRDLQLTAGERRVQVDEAHRQSDRGFLSRTTTTTRSQVDATGALASTFSGHTVQMEAGRDIAVSGSNVVSTQGTHLSAGRDVLVGAASQSSLEQYQRAEKKSGVFGAGTGFTIGQRAQASDTQAAAMTAAGSTIGSTDGSVVIVAGNDYRQVGSQVLAPRGDIAIDAVRVQVLEARESAHSQTKTQARSSGLTVTVSNPVMDTARTASHLRAAARDSGDSRMQLLAGTAIALDGVASASQAMADPAHLGGVNLTASLGTSKSKSSSTQASDTGAGSKVAAGGTVQLRARGAGQDSDIAVQGSRVEGGDRVVLQADGDVHLRASRNTASQQASNESSGVSLAATIGFAAKQPPAALTLGVSRGRGSADGDDLTVTPATIAGGTGVEIDAKGDVTLQGAVVSAPRLTSRIGGNLVVGSLQDSSRYDSRQRSVNASVSVAGNGAVSGQVGLSRSDASRRYDNVDQQSGFFAGDGGFDIAVKGHTDLKAGVLASSQAAADAGINRFSTATLTTSDLHNAASARASSSGFSVSSDMFQRGTYGAVKGVAANTLVNASGSLNAEGQTRAAVSAGQVTITNDAAQRALTGAGADATIASLNRDTAGAHASVARPDLESLQRKVEATRQVKEGSLRVISGLSDVAYDSRMRADSTYSKVQCPPGANCVADPSLVVRQPVTREEIIKNEGPTVIAVNGIFNDTDRASQLAYQNNVPNEATGEKAGAIFQQHIAPANNAVSEMFGVIYERLTVASDGKVGGALGFTRAQEEHAYLIRSRGQAPTQSEGHSRGTLIQAGAMYILANPDKPSVTAPFTSDKLGFQAVGGALPVDSYTRMASALLPPGIGPSKITFNYFENDPVAVSFLAGGNPGRWSFGDLFKVGVSAQSPHSCYGTGAPGCAQVERPVSGGPQGTPDGNSRLIQFVGGVRVESSARNSSMWEAK